MEGLLPRMMMLEQVDEDRANEREVSWINASLSSVTNVAGVIEAPEREEVTDTVLANSLKAWFSRVTGVSGQARRKSPVWVALREIVSAFGNWRNAPRGDPKKGFASMKKGENE